MKSEPSNSDIQFMQKRNTSNNSKNKPARKNTTKIPDAP